MQESEQRGLLLRVQPHTTHEPWAERLYLPAVLSRGVRRVQGVDVHHRGRVQQHGAAWHPCWIFCQGRRQQLQGGCLVSEFES